MSDETRLREEICRVGRSLFERGYVHATAGNISVRLGADRPKQFLEIGGQTREGENRIGELNGKLGEK